ncbi:nucleolar complex protein 2 isoform X2 [Arctopsyche grandis]|uniref:nucleolar complex protein 2 isoform X2 n=1 Tax=Arctopsyche grandis TaxID=121162 RepID=UPI00406D6F50
MGLKRGIKRSHRSPAAIAAAADSDDELESQKDLDPKEFANSLHKLKDTDPEFYNFLEENDRKLLNFRVDSDDDGDNDDQNGSDSENVHVPDAKLQEESEDSDFEDENQVTSSNKLTMKMITQWQTELQSTVKIELSTISNVVKAFHAALLRVTATEGDDTKSEFIVEGSGVFNAVIQMCVLYLKPALKKVLRLQTSDRNPQKSKRWIKVKGLLKMYFLDIIKLLGGVTSTNILNVLLKHLHQMSTFFGCFPSLAKVLFKRLTYLWSTSEETVRVLAFLCILRVTSNNQALLLDNVLKMMYMTYVKNSKFVSPTTLPGISFMRRSLIEMLALDVNVSYHHVFLYVRQLAIHLRNAIVLHKKENIQVVYNWQFVNSLQLWAELFAATKSKPQLQTLTYPLVMIITNTIKLIPTAQYYPLRFHCVKILINLSRDADIYIPIMPYLLEVLTSYDFSKKHKKVSMKPMNFACILRLSKSHLSENGFKDAVIENIYMLLLETLSLYSHTISFPDTTIMPLLQLKQFLKSCSVANYSRKIRLVVDKIEENSKFIETQRKKVTFQLRDIEAIKAWETNIQNLGTPMQTYYDNLRKISNIQKKKSVTKNSDLADNLPTIKRKPPSADRKPASKDVELFPSDSEGEFFMEDEEDMPKPPKKKSKKADKVKSKSKKAVDDESETIDNEAEDKDDELEDFNLVDW